MQGPQLYAEPRHFCKLDVVTSDRLGHYTANVLTIKTMETGKMAKTFAV